MINPPLVTESTKEGLRSETNFMVVRTRHDGDMLLFAAGRYLDLVVFNGTTPQFAEKTVVVDSNKIDTLLASNVSILLLSTTTVFSANCGVVPLNTTRSRYLPAANNNMSPSCRVRTTMKFVSDRSPSLVLSVTNGGLITWR